MSILLYYSNDEDGQVEKQLRAALPDHTIQVWPEHDLQSIEYAIVWNPPDDVFAGLDNLKCIFSIAAGVDHLLDHPELPTGIPIVRLENAGMGEKIAEYVLYGVLHAQRSMQFYRDNQHQQRWDDQSRDQHSHEYKVGIMGVGAIGRIVATRLRDNGYQVRGWSNSAKTIDGVKCYHSRSQLPDFLAALDVVVCLLPLTPDTRHILDKEVFSRMAKGGFVINAARGGHLHNNDFSDALQSGQLTGALLDVTDPEPLPAGHQFWTLPGVLITPHIAGPTQARESITQIAENIRRFEAGDKMNGLVVPARGY